MIVLSFDSIKIKLIVTVVKIVTRFGVIVRSFGLERLSGLLGNLSGFQVNQKEVKKWQKEEVLRIVTFRIGW